MLSQRQDFMKLLFVALLLGSTAGVQGKQGKHKSLINLESRHSRHAVNFRGGSQKQDGEEIDAASDEIESSEAVVSSADQEEHSADQDEEEEKSLADVVEEITEIVETAVAEDGTPESVRKIATDLRFEGKSSHDAGDFSLAADTFQKAADMLAPVIQNGESEDETALIEDYITCRLHEALCHLKGDEYEECIRTCTSVLQDEDPENDGDGDDSIQSTSWNLPSTNAPAIRARAYHRRAKAKLALDDAEGALKDARSAAFLGDRKAVSLYGKLMREPSFSSSGGNIDDSSSSMNPFEGFMSPPSTSSDSSAPNSALLDSLLSKSPLTSGASSSSGDSLLGGFSPLSMLMGKGGKKDGGLAGSVVKSLTKRLEDDSTHKTICSYLKQTNNAQIHQLSEMAGMQLPDAQVTRLVNFCHGVTPRTIRRTVKTSKRVIYAVQLIRRLFQVLAKYKTLIVGLILFQWTKSALYQPIPVNRRAAKAALKAAMKASRHVK